MPENSIYKSYPAAFYQWSRIHVTKIFPSSKNMDGYVCYPMIFKTRPYDGPEELRKLTIDMLHIFPDFGGENCLLKNVGFSKVN
jgi:hypothetical protein